MVYIKFLSKSIKVRCFLPIAKGGLVSLCKMTRRDYQGLHRSTQILFDGTKEEDENTKNLTRSSVIGIDLGITNSCVGIMDGGSPRILENVEGFRTTPSVVSFDSNGNISAVGLAAKKQLLSNPKNTISSMKRLIGRKFADLSETEKQTFNFKVVADKDGFCSISLQNGMLKTPHEVTSIVLQKMKETAENFLGDRVTTAVIAVPFHFNDAQKNATKEAAKLAGLEVKDLVTEPMAAALAYGIQKKAEGTFVLFDLGGGTYDISVLTVQDGVVEIKATFGDSLLGGDNFDRILMDFVIKDFKRKEGVHLTDPIALQKVKDACENAKIELSTSMTAVINLPFIAADASGPKNIHMTITRATLDFLAEEVLRGLQEPTKRCLEMAGISNVKDISDVYLIGGGTKVQKIAQWAEEFFQRKPVKDFPPDEVIAMGAAVRGGVMVGAMEAGVAVDVLPMSIGIEVLGGSLVKIIPRGTPLPFNLVSQYFSTVSDNQSQLKLKFFQGERELATANKFLCEMDIELKYLGPRGIPKVEISMDIDSKGLLKITAKDKLGDAMLQPVEVPGLLDIKGEDLKKALEDAEFNYESDRRRNNPDVAMQAARATADEVDLLLTNPGFDIPMEARSEMEASLRSLREIMAAVGLEFDARQVNHRLNRTKAIFEKIVKVYGSEKNKNNAEINTEKEPKMSEDDMRKLTKQIAHESNQFFLQQRKISWVPRLFWSTVAVGCVVGLWL